MGGDQGREARGLRQSRHGEGEAGQDRREGLPRESPQGRVLRASRSEGEPREEAPRVLLQFLLLLLVLPSVLPGIFVTFCPGWLEGAWSCMAFQSQDARLGRSHVLHQSRKEK